MKSFMIIALCVVASLGAPSKPQADLDSHLKEAAARGIDQSSLEKIKTIVLQPATTVKQMKQQIDDFVKTLPEEQQKKIGEFAEEIEARQAVFFEKVMRQFEVAGGDANKLGQQMLATFQDENLTSDQMKEKIRDIIISAPDALKEQLDELAKQFDQSLMEMFAN